MLPTMSSADFCFAITINCSTVSCSFNTKQISRGKTHHCRYVNAGFIKHSPIADGRLRGLVPTRLSYVTPPIRFLFIIP